MHRKWERFRIQWCYFRLKITVHDRWEFNIPRWDDIDWYEWLVLVIKWPAYRLYWSRELASDCFFLLLSYIYCKFDRHTHMNECLLCYAIYIRFLSFCPMAIICRCISLAFSLSLLLLFVRTIINRIDRDEECL